MVSTNIGNLHKSLAFNAKLFFNDILTPEFHAEIPAQPPDVGADPGAELVLVGGGAGLPLTGHESDLTVAIQDAAASGNYMRKAEVFS